MIKANDSSAYDALGTDLRTLSKGRAEYLSTIDRLVCDNIPSGLNSMLDVGAGDGVRADGIRSIKEVETLVLVEPSPVMARLCRQIASAEVWPVAAENLPDLPPQFQVITCLWNVLGHIEGTRNRQAALGNMRRLLTPGGFLFLDVNNRYNASAYGVVRTFLRLLYDLISPSETHGDVSFDWNIHGRVIRAMGHVFRPREIESLLTEAGLTILKRYVIDDQTGELRRHWWQGHLLYVIDTSPSSARDNSNEHTE